MNRISPAPQTVRHLAAELSQPRVEVSVIVPLLNEVETLVPLTDGIAAALADRQYEIIFVDDGSRDGSWSKIVSLARQPSLNARGLRHRRNFGKAEALSSGFREARGDRIVTIDADLQDDPAEIPSLLAKLEEGFDLVSGWKQSRQDPLSKTVPSLIFNLATRAISGIAIHDFNCGLKAYRREVVEHLDLYGELHRFIPIIAHSQGFLSAEVPVRHHPRQKGVSKYGWGRFAKGFLDLLTIAAVTRYQRRPGHFFGGAGLLIGLVGGSVLAYLSFMKLAFGQSIDGRPLFFFGILATLFGGQLISTGIIAEFFLRHRARDRESARRCIRSTTHGDS